jgi:hypothetical protein
MNTSFINNKHYSTVLYWIKPIQTFTMYYVYSSVLSFPIEHGSHIRSDPIRAAIDPSGSGPTSSVYQVIWSIPVLFWEHGSWFQLIEVVVKVPNGVIDLSSIPNTDRKFRSNPIRSDPSGRSIDPSVVPISPVPSDVPISFLPSSKYMVFQVLFCSEFESEHFSKLGP